MYFRPISGNPLMTDEYRSSDAYVNDLYVSDEYFKNHLLRNSDSDDYYDFIHTRTPEFSEKCFNKKCDYSVGNLVVSAAYLDHPEILYKTDGIKIDNQLVAKYGAKRIDREIEFVREETKDMSDKDKILYVYNYIGKHNYDYLFTDSKNNQSIYSFFSKGSSVCAGFAKTSQILFQNIGIKSFIVMGYSARSYVSGNYIGQNMGHMWNYVEYEGKYYIFDATWAAGGAYSVYDGLGDTTIEITKIYYEELYPNIETEKLRDVFGV